MQRRKYTFGDESTVAAMWSSYGRRLEYALALGPVRSRLDLATHIGISEQAVGAVIRSPTSQLKADNSAKAAAYLKVDHYWLATGTGEPRPPATVSPLGLDLAQAFDRLAPSLRDRVYAMLMQTIDLASPSPAPIAPTALQPNPEQHRRT